MYFVITHYYPPDRSDHPDPDFKKGMQLTVPFEKSRL